MWQDEVISKMNSVKHYFENLVCRIREHVEKPNLRPKGPHGLPAYITVEAVTWVLDTLKSLKAVISNVRPDYLQVFLSLSILTVVVQHFFSSMREQYPMPYVLQFAQLLVPTIQETVKLTNTASIHYTRKTAHYPDPVASVRYSNLTWPEKPPTVTLTPGH